jgi:hypothetical protein
MMIESLRADRTLGKNDRVGKERITVSTTEGVGEKWV